MELVKNLYFCVCIKGSDNLGCIALTVCAVVMLLGGSSTCVWYDGCNTASGTAAS